MVEVNVVEGRVTVTGCDATRFKGLFNLISMTRRVVSASSETPISGFLFFLTECLISLNIDEENRGEGEGLLFPRIGGEGEEFDDQFGL